MENNVQVEYLSNEDIVVPETESFLDLETDIEEVNEKSNKVIIKHLDPLTFELTGYEVDGIIYPFNPENEEFINKLINEEGYIFKDGLTDNEILEKNKLNLINKIQSLADYWSSEVKKYLAGLRLSDNQYERYEIKYQAALDAEKTGDYSFFNYEAEIENTTPEVIAKTVINLHDKWLAVVKEKTKLIESFRILYKKEVQKIVTKEELERFKYIISYVEDNFGYTTTWEDVKHALTLEKPVEENLA